MCIERVCAVCTGYIYSKRGCHFRAASDVPLRKGGALMRQWFGTPTTLQWVALLIAVAALCLVVGAEFLGTRTEIYILHITTQGGALPWRL